MSENSPRKKYEVGYGKPPKQTQFKKGKSGNPKGRNKGVKNLKTDLAAALSKMIRITIDGKKYSITTQQALLELLRTNALNKRDHRALKTLLEYSEKFNLFDDLTADKGPLPSDDQKILEEYTQKILSGNRSAKGENDET